MITGWFHNFSALKSDRVIGSTFDGLLSSHRHIFSVIALKFWVHHAILGDMAKGRIIVMNCLKILEYKWGFKSAMFRTNGLDLFRNFHASNKRPHLGLQECFDIRKIATLRKYSNLPPWSIFVFSIASSLPANLPKCKLLLILSIG